MAKQPTSNTLAVPPDITEVVDTQGNPVPDGGTTADTTVILSGIGEASAVVRVQDGQTSIGNPSVELDGSWTQDAPGLSEGLHRFTVRNADGLDPPGEWRITVSTALDLIPPKVTQAPGNVLDPLVAQSGVDVVVEYTGMLTSDTIGLSWNGLDDLVGSQNGSTSGRVTFHLTASAVAAALGKTIAVLYTVVRNGTPKPSNVLNLTVESLPPSALEAPIITQAANNGEGPELDVTGLTADADLSVKPWPFIDAGQRISLRFEGTRADGTTYNWPHPGWQDLEITSPGQPYTKVALSDLKELKDGSILRVIFEVSFDGGITRVPFPVRTYTVKALEIVIPEITSVIETASGTEIPANGTTYSTNVTLKGTASVDQQVQILNGATLLDTVPASGGTWELPLTGLAVSTYSIKARGLYGNNPESRVRSFTVAAATAPTITSIQDASRNEIPANGMTYSANVTLTGAAPAGERVDILNGATLLGTVTANGGIWTLPLTGLLVSTYNIKARGTYGNNPESEVRSFTVALAYEDFERAPEGFYYPPTPLVLETMTIVATAGRLRVSGPASGYDPYLVGKTVGILHDLEFSSGAGRFTFKVPANRIRFGCVALTGSTATLYGYDEQDKLLFTDRIASGIGMFKEYGGFSTRIKSMVVIGGATSGNVVQLGFDNFTFS